MNLGHRGPPTAFLGPVVPVLIVLEKNLYAACFQDVDDFIVELIELIVVGGRPLAFFAVDFAEVVKEGVGERI